MPGYSGTPLAKKLGIKDGFRVALVHVPGDVKGEFAPRSRKCRIKAQWTRRGVLDFVFLCKIARGAAT